jgi:sarcosine oxidase subunit gamma
MAETTALKSVLQPGRSGAAGQVGVTIAERHDLSIVQVSVIPGVPAKFTEIQAVIGTALPAPGKAVAGRRTVLSTGPGRWFVVDAGRGTLANELEMAAAGSFAITDLSHSRTVLRISGARMRDVIAQCCAVDLHPRAAKSDDCFATAVARHAALLHLVNDATVDVYAYRSFGQDLFESLVGASRPYGYEVVDRGQ